MRKIIFFANLVIFLINTAFAQIPLCGFDHLRPEDTAFRQKEDQFNLALYQKTIQTGLIQKSPQSVFHIPVVVHIIHQNGPENLSDSTVNAAIQQLNLRFQNAAPYYDSTGHNVQIQFCLASVDPQGHPTTGITRNYSSYAALFAGNDVLMKNLNRWDPHFYFNIWTVLAIFGVNIPVAGYSSLPPNVGDNTDGVVLLFNVLNSDVLAHETGHYLGLYHTFQGGCKNYNCLLDGDCVCDTPPDTSTNVCMGNSCSTDINDTTGFSPFTSDVNDLPNYMDYTPCALSFSQGQANRMTDALTGTRYLLLQSPGCGYSGANAAVAHFSSNISLCHDGLVEFSDSLSSNVATVNWDFNNDGVYDAFVHKPQYTFPATGTYTVKLFITGPGGPDSTYQTIFVQKSPSLYYPIASMMSVYPNQNGVMGTCAGNMNVFTAAPAVSYQWSNGQTTQTVTFYAATNYDLNLTIVDSTGLTWTNQVCHPLTVHVYPSPPVPNIYSYDSLTMCQGDTVTFHASISPPGNYYILWSQNGAQSGYANDTVFKTIGHFPGEYILALAGNNYGCYSQSNVLTIYPYSPPMAQTLTQNGFTLSSDWGDGNQWYMNGVAIPGETGQDYTVTQAGCYTVGWYYSYIPQCITMSDSICFTTVGVGKTTGQCQTLLIYPVPSGNTIMFRTTAENIGTPYTFMDPLGRCVMTGKIESVISDVDITKLARGVYFVNLEFIKEHIVRKIVKE